MSIGKHKSENNSSEHTNRKIPIKKWKTDKYASEIHIGKIRVGKYTSEIQLEKYNSEKYNSEDTNRKYRSEKYKPADTTWKSTILEAWTREYESGTSSRETLKTKYKLENMNQETPIGTYQPEKYKSEKHESEKYTMGNTSQ